MKNIVLIVQARMTSTRLPRKVLLPLGKRTVLGQVLHRCKLIKNVNTICCAIPTGKQQDQLVSEIKKYTSTIYRGSEKNVLQRYYEAAKTFKADIIMRITSDCPLINPIVCEHVLQLHLNTNADFTCNNTPPSWPHGYDCEVFSFNALEKAIQHATDMYDLEHVTPWIRKHFPVQNFANPNGNEYHYRLTLDNKDDFKRIKNYFNYNIFCNN